MSDVIIQNPVINSPFAEPARHFEFGERGITGRIVDGARRDQKSARTLLAVPKKIRAGKDDGDLVVVELEYRIEYAG